ncbi:hypothetical protein predicted by Glimmer/Critica [Lactiplantibacillus plantarum]|nr:hypothetical protein predicted by Glimmer/Critica [Lactiplantibacillus plantarum]
MIHVVALYTAVLQTPFKIKSNLILKSRRFAAAFYIT